MPLSNSIEAARRAARLASGALVGVADAGFRVIASSPELDALLGGQACGRSLVDLADPSVRDPSLPWRLRLVLSRVTPASTLELGSGVWLVLRGLSDAPPTLSIHRASAGVGGPPARTPSRVFGRESELAEIERYLVDSDPSVLFVRAPLGMGKTALLEALAERLDELACPRFLLDARAVPPTRNTIARAFTGSDGGAELSLHSVFRSAHALSGGRWVLLIDNFDAWQVGVSDAPGPFIPCPCDCRIVVASREHPDPRWWSTAGRAPRVLHLGPLSPEAAGELATANGVAPSSVAEVTRLAARHPLSVLKLSAAFRTGAPPERATVPVSRLGYDDLDVLELAALPARITEDVLDALMDGTADPRRAYDRLATVCTPDPSGTGLRMPHVVRETLRGRLRERSPSRFSTSRSRLTAHYAKLLEARIPAHGCTALDDFLDTFDDHPVVRNLTGNHFDGLPTTRRLTPADRPRLVEALVDTAPRDVVDSVLARFDRGHAHTLAAMEGDKAVGVLQFAAVSGAALQQAEDSSGDVELAAAFEALRRFVSLSASEQAFAIVSWVSRETTESRWGRVSQALLRQLFRSMLHPPRPMATAFVHHPHLVPIPRLAPHASTRDVIGGREVVVHDLRYLGPSTFLRSLVELSHDGTSTLEASPPDPITPGAVREALGALGEIDRLAASALITLPAVIAEAGADATPQARARALATILHEALASIDAGSRDTKRHDVLHAVFVERSGKHEKIAADLGLPYGTFRRVLARGVERIAEILRDRM